MTWKKHFSVVKTGPVLPQVDRSQAYSSMTARTSSWLNIAYQGNPQRIPRYYQFQEMDNDSDINTALDTIADFCTQSEEQSDEPFEVKFNGDPNESETKIINQMLDRWIKLNNFRSRLWYMFRDTIKNGDAFFLRDPETFEWLWLDHFMVELVKVDETKGKIPDEYIVRGLDYNRQTKFATKQADPNAYRTPFGTSTVGGARPVGGASSSPSTFSMVGADGDSRQRSMQNPNSQDLSVIDANHVVHLSLSIGNDINWPFGPSILEPVFKTFKQKELLEDAIIIYRVQRAPERRIFYIDVGNMPPERAKRHIEAIKNDIHQRRIPNRTGTGGSIMDAAYNPLSINDDYFFANNSEGRGSKVETLPGGDGNNEILDLTFFSKKLARALRVPTSYLNIGDDSSNSITFNDGKLGAAMIQEYRFSKYCMRLQALLSPKFDEEFKRFLVKNGIEIEAGLFELRFNPPQSFTRYRQIELDTQRVAVYQGVAENKKLAERFKLKRFLGLSEDEIIENEELWSEENADKLKKKTGASPAEETGDGLSAVGIHPEGDMGAMGEMPEGENPEGEPGADGATPGAAPAAPGGGAAPATVAPPAPAGT